MSKHSHGCLKFHQCVVYLEQQDYALQLAIPICPGACLGNEWAASRHEDEQDRSLTDLRPHVALHEDPHRTDGKQRIR